MDFINIRFLHLHTDKGLIKPDETFEVKIILKLGNNVPEKFILIEGTRKTEIKPFKIENNSYYFGYNAKGKINKAFTITGGLFRKEP